MSAPHFLEFDVYFKGEKISQFGLDVDLDLPTEIVEEVGKLFGKQRWFDAKCLFRLSEHLYYCGKGDFVIEDHWYNSETGELRLVLTDVKDWG